MTQIKLNKTMQHLAFDNEMNSASARNNIKSAQKMCRKMMLSKLFEIDISSIASKPLYCILLIHFNFHIRIYACSIVD